MFKTTRFLMIIGCFFCVFSAFSEPANLSLLKNEIKHYYDSGVYQKELERVSDEAKTYLLQQVKINKEHKPLALVLDIDETSLSNYSGIISRDFSGNQKKINKAILAADAPAIQPILNLYQLAIQQGIDVFFVTGRPQSAYQATETNLLNAGFTQWKGLYMRPDSETPSSIIPFKSNTRKAITQQGYVVVASIGDQWSDLKGGFAQKTFKLPNPFYYLP